MRGYGRATEGDSTARGPLRLDSVQNAGSGVILGPETVVLSQVVGGRTACTGVGCGGHEGSRRIHAGCRPRDPLVPLIGGLLVGEDDVLVASGPEAAPIVTKTGAQFALAGCSQADCLDRLATRTSATKT